MARTVVLIDDETDLVLMLTQVLKMKGYEVFSAGTGQQGLDLVQRLNPDAVICDLMMPGMSGLEVCRRLRGDPATQSLPIVVISALGAESDRPEEFWAAGLKSDDFISKPFEPHELLGRLEYVLRKSQYVSTQGAKGRAQKAETAVTALDGSPVEPVDLSEAAPKIVVRSFIEAWNSQDFETEFQCMDPTLTGGLALAEYIARRRQVYAKDSGDERKQLFVKVISQRRTASDTSLRCERKDIFRGRPQYSVEDYRLKKTPNGWKIVHVRKAAKSAAEDSSDEG